ncbi:hypothetical protein VTH06DRAFT_2912 [Thermothelomyces fergusii]
MTGDERRMFHFWGAGYRSTRVFQGFHHWPDRKVNGREHRAVESVYFVALENLGVRSHVVCVLEWHPHRKRIMSMIYVASVSVDNGSFLDVLWYLLEPAPIAVF